MLTTDRLYIRRARVSDAEHIFRYSSDPQVSAMAGFPLAKSVDDTVAFLKGAVASRTSYVFALVLKETGEVIGTSFFGLAPPPKCTKSPELPSPAAVSPSVAVGSEWMYGYALQQAHWGRGIVPEAGAALLKAAVEGGFIAENASCCGEDESGEAKSSFSVPTAEDPAVVAPPVTAWGAPGTVFGLPGPALVHATAYPANARSRAVLTRLGFDLCEETVWAKRIGRETEEEYVVLQRVISPVE